MRNWFLTLGSWLLLTQCALGQNGTREDLAFFEQKIRPLLVEKCFECHSQQFDEHKGGLRLDARESILAGGDNGPAVIERQPEQSLLIRAIHYTDPDIEMPPDGKLSAREIALLEEWVRRGVPYPASEASGAVRKSIDIEAGKQHWAFLPLGRVDEVEVHDASWPTSRIDRFVLAEQEKRGWHPSPPAARAALLRRAKFDLVGLPPTFEEVEAFLSDDAPDALARRIDRWLATPEYGERWSRFWLELARYCDIAESWAETEGNSFFYRDWVVKAFNDDVPFDRFAMLQLAADHMTDTQPADLAALGFIGLSPSYWKELQLPVEIIKTIVSDEYEERIHTFSSTFLGLNLACARCHDHKHDPITTEDYYALAGVFASTRTIDRSLLPDVDSQKIVEARRQAKKLELEQKKLEGELKKLKADDPAAQPKRTEKEKRLSQIHEEIAAARATEGFDAPLSPGVQDASLEVKEAIGTHGSRLVYEAIAKNLNVEIRGNPNKVGAVVPRRFVSVLSREEPQVFSGGSGRLELAQTMFRECQPLMARVLVNRLWKLHFGCGLVETPSDFGTQGDPPSHPGLLDDLARRLIEHDWSLKWLHREIVTSATYQQQACSSNVATDPDNRFYTRMPLRRLEVEQWRDAMLQATGTLDHQIGGPPVELSQPTNHRRTLYGTVKRRELSDVLRLHDFPDPITHSPSRTLTTTPLQQLFTLNSPFMLAQATALTARLQREGEQDDRHRIDAAYELLFARRPDDAEMQAGLEFVAGKDANVWEQYAQILLGTNEVYFVD